MMFVTFNNKLFQLFGNRKNRWVKISYRKIINMLTFSFTLIYFVTQPYNLTTNH